MTIILCAWLSECITCLFTAECWADTRTWKTQISLSVDVTYICVIEAVVYLLWYFWSYFVCYAYLICTPYWIFCSVYRSHCSCIYCQHYVSLKLPDMHRGYPQIIIILCVIGLHFLSAIITTCLYFSSLKFVWFSLFYGNSKTSSYSQNVCENKNCRLQQTTLSPLIQLQKTMKKRYLIFLLRPLQVYVSLCLYVLCRLALWSPPLLQHHLSNYDSTRNPGCYAITSDSLFCSSAVLDPRVGHTMNVFLVHLSPSSAILIDSCMVSPVLMLAYLMAVQKFELWAIIAMIYPVVLLLPWS